jgi:hypothetical protein
VPTKLHSTLTGSDLHINKVDATTGTELTAPSETIYDARWLKQTGGTITPTSDSMTTFKVTKAANNATLLRVDSSGKTINISEPRPATT